MLARLSWTPTWSKCSELCKGDKGDRIEQEDECWGGVGDNSGVVVTSTGSELESDPLGFVLLSGEGGCWTVGASVFVAATADT